MERGLINSISRVSGHVARFVWLQAHRENSMSSPRHRTFSIPQTSLDVWSGKTGAEAVTLDLVHVCCQPVVHHDSMCNHDAGQKIQALCGEL